MAPSNPLAYWERVGDSFYRKVPVYDAIFDEDVELENYIVTGAPYGGAIGMNLCTWMIIKGKLIFDIALYRDESKLFRFQGAQTTKSSIDIYSYSGKHINRINVGPCSLHVVCFCCLLTICPVGIWCHPGTRLVRQRRTPGGF